MLIDLLSCHHEGQIHTKARLHPVAGHERACNCIRRPIAPDASSLKSLKNVWGG